MVGWILNSKSWSDKRHSSLKNTWVGSNKRVFRLSLGILSSDNYLQNCNFRDQNQKYITDKTIYNQNTYHFYFPGIEYPQYSFYSILYFYSKFIVSKKTGLNQICFWKSDLWLTIAILIDNLQVISFVIPHHSIWPWYGTKW